MTPVLILLLAGFLDGLPDALPDALPDVAVVEVPVTVDVVRTDALLQPLGGHWERRCGPLGCRQVWVADPAPPLTVDAAAARLAKGNLTAEESKRLETIIDDHYRTAVDHRWGPGTCGMLGCTIHGAQYFDVFPDGSQEPAKVQPPGLYDGGSGRRLFRRRR